MAESTVYLATCFESADQKPKSRFVQLASWWVTGLNSMQRMPSLCLLASSRRQSQRTSTELHSLELEKPCVAVAPNDDGFVQTP